LDQSRSRMRGLVEDIYIYVKYDKLERLSAVVSLLLSSLILVVEL
jgi:hypothetical protein